MIHYWTRSKKIKSFKDNEN